jgi:hypothetical protein
MFIQQALPKSGCKEIIPYEPDYTFLKQKKWEMIAKHDPGIIPHLRYH